jgi:hypothetical protein
VPPLPHGSGKLGREVRLLNLGLLHEEAIVNRVNWQVSK